MRLSETEKKYLLRLNLACIPHDEFTRNGKRAVAVIEKLGERGLARRVDLDGELAPADDPDAIWEITEDGEAALA